MTSVFCCFWFGLVWFGLINVTCRCRGVSAWLAALYRPVFVDGFTGIVLLAASSGNVAGFVCGCLYACVCVYVYVRTSSLVLVLVPCFRFRTS